MTLSNTLHESIGKYTQRAKISMRTALCGAAVTGADFSMVLIDYCAGPDLEIVPNSVYLTVGILGAGAAIVGSVVNSKSIGKLEELATHHYEISQNKDS